MARRLERVALLVGLWMLFAMRSLARPSIPLCIFPCRLGWLDLDHLARALVVSAHK